MNKETFFTVDAKAILTLGRDSIRSHTTALLELVKNSYDADATIVEVEISDDYIRISDNGCGMSTKEIENNWLRIGHSEKKDDKTTKKKRRKTGEKGVGRLSADRLGKGLVLRTKSKAHNPVQINVDWEKFDVKGKTIGDIPVGFSNAESLDIPKSTENTGTELIIKKLRQKWSATDIAEIYEELSALISPFAGKNDFQILFKNHLSSSLNGYIKALFFEAAEIVIKANYDEKKNLISYVIEDNQSKKKTKGALEWAKASQSVIDPFKKSQENNKLSCGPTEVSILFYSRTVTDLLKSQGLNLSKLKEFLNKNTGVKIYRDNISVKPYGFNDDSGDWLNLAERKGRDPAGLARPTYKVSSHQIVGAVSVGRDINPNLKDSTSREGLVKNNAFYDLRSFSLACVGILERYRHEEYKKTQKNSDSTGKSTIQDVEEFKNDLEKFEKDLSEIKEVLKSSPDQDRAQEAYEKVDTLVRSLPEARKSVEELLDYNRLLGGLSTVGIASAVFGHETQSSIAEFKLSASVSHKALLRKKGPDLEVAKEELVKSLRYAEQVAAWGIFALNRISRDKRIKSKIKVNEVIFKVLNSVKPIFISASINLDCNLNDVEARVFPMEIESIVINLLTNAYTACLQKQKLRRVNVKLSQKNFQKISGFEISISDSGPGIDKSMEKTIWEPLVTTKKDSTGKDIGTGLGLTIIDSIIKEMKGNRKVEKDQQLKGANFVIWLPKN